MRFQNPDAFWLLFLLLIPILIHLFNLRKVKTVYFTNLFFLKQAEQKRKSTTTLRKWLILLSRLAFLLMLVLAFADPRLLSEAGVNENGALFVDHSMSMQRPSVTGATLLSEAVALARADASNLTGPVSLVTIDAPASGWLMSETLDERLGELDFVGQALPLSTAAERAKRAGAKVLTVFSDLQRNTVGDLTQLANDTTMNYRIYDLDPLDVSNIYVDTVYLTSAPGLQNETQLLIRLGLSGADEQRIQVRLEKDDRQIYSELVEVQHGKEITLALGVTTSPYGAYRITLSDPNVTFDNIYFFAINPAPRRQVVVISEGTPNRYLSKVFFNTSYFQVNFFQVQDYTESAVLRADLVVLDHLSLIPDWLLNRVGAIAGRVLVIPAETIDLSSYAQLLGGVPELVVSEKVALSTSTLDHPFFARIFLKKSDRMSMPSARVMFKTSALSEVLLQTSEGLPVLAARDRQRLLFFTTTLNEVSTDFANHSLFVPVMYRLAQEAAADQLAFPVSASSITVPVDSMAAGATVRLVSSTQDFTCGFQRIPAGLRVDLPGDWLVPGNYVVLNGADTLWRAAFNFSKEESTTDVYTGNELQEIVAGATHIQLLRTENGQVPNGAGGPGSGSEGLWKYALFLALGFLLIELALLRFVE